MEGINPVWYARMLWYQKKYNIILTSATTILAITSILQIFKIYEVEIPNYLIFGVILMILLILEFIIIESFKNPNF